MNWDDPIERLAYCIAREILADMGLLICGDSIELGTYMTPERPHTWLEKACKDYAYVQNKTR